MRKRAQIWLPTALVGGLLLIGWACSDDRTGLWLLGVGEGLFDAPIRAGLAGWGGIFDALVGTGCKRASGTRRFSAYWLGLLG